MLSKVLVLLALIVVGAIGTWYFLLNQPGITPTIPNQPLEATLSPQLDSSLEEIVINSPSVNQTISSPINITGEARGPWFFEASFPIQIVDANGNFLGQSIATANGEWMTEELVPFTATLNFERPATETGTIIFQKDNPSGLPENERRYELPVKFETNLNTEEISLFFYNQKDDLETNNNNPSCDEEFITPVKRGVVQNPLNLEYTINSLLKGDLTQEEIEQGFTTEFPLTGLTLKNTTINNGVAQLTFNDPQNQTTGGSCRVNILRAQIEKTALEYPGISSVEILPQELFQP